MPILTITDLTKNFGDKTILDYIGLEVETGEIVGIFGRNGSGKSTLLKILSGTLKPDTCRLYINKGGIDVKNILPQRLIACLPQLSCLPKGLKVNDIVMMCHDDKALQEKILCDAMIAKISATAAGKLSMGELRYFELMLIAHMPHPFLLLDEPFSMIEPLYREKIREFLHQIKVTKGIIITDHYYNDVFLTSDRNLLLKNGRLIPVTTKEDLAGHGYLPY